MRQPDIHIEAATLAAIRRDILAFYRRHKRDLHFRETDDPYAITVSEVMLQQTQVERVVPKYLQWLQRFPDWPALAHAANRDILAAWSGLGYNRRAMYLKAMAQEVCARFGGRLPEEPDQLREFPGIGPYAANAIAAFAFGRRVAAVDTNIRKVIIHKLRLAPDTPLKEIQPIATSLLPRSRVREWHYALMDYARLGLPSEANRRIAPLSRQSRFQGSQRQIRGEIIRRLTTRRQVAIADIADAMERSLDDVRLAAEALMKDGLVTVTARMIKLA